MLCHGYQRTNNPRQPNEDHPVLAGIPGLVSYYPNSNISTLKSAGWSDILRLLGKEGDRVMLDMILGCGIFVAINGARGNFYQLSGTTDLQSINGNTYAGCRNSDDRIASSRIVETRSCCSNSSNDKVGSHRSRKSFVIARPDRIKLSVSFEHHIRS